MIEPTPSFSIVLPTYNRPKRLRDCLGAVAALDYPREQYEVIVVDDGSPRPALPVVEAINAEVGADWRVRAVRQDNAGPAAARNYGAREARGEYLVFLDDDCRPRRDWLRAFAGGFAGRPDALLGGRIANALANNARAEASQWLTDFVYGWGRRQGHGTGPGRTWLFNSSNLACRPANFERAGRFDEEFPLAAGEDHDFCHRYQHVGLPADYLPEAVIDHYHDMSLRGFARQHFGYGRGLLQFHRRAMAREAESARRRHGEFQLKLAGFLLSRLRGPKSWSVAAHVALSQAATFAGAAAEAFGDRQQTRRARRSETPRVKSPAGGGA